MLRILYLAMVVALCATPVLAQPPADPSPNEFIMVDEEAKPLNMRELKECIYYPALAKRDSIVGRVVLRVLVNAQGGYVRHVVSKTPHPWLTEPVELCISMLRFSPALQNGNPVPMWVNVPFNFTLSNTPTPAPTDSTAGQ